MVRPRWHLHRLVVERLQAPVPVDDDHLLRLPRRHVTPIPGESSGMPGSARPTTSGLVDSRRRMAPAGTCPSMTYPSTSAVWHDPAPTGTPWDFLNAEISGSSVSCTSAPRLCRYPTHDEQQPQPGVSCTSIWMPASDNSADPDVTTVAESVAHADVIRTSPVSNARTLSTLLPQSVICSIPDRLCPHTHERVIGWQ